MSTLYERLGAASGIHNLVDDIIEAHMHNPVIQQRFLPYRERPEDLDQAKAHLRDFLAMGSGGPDQYQGRSMPESHRGMNISPGEYMAAVDDIMMVMDRHGMDEPTKKDVLLIAWSLKDDIMHQ
ncbi:MAG: group I truncated hemoglobin [Pseudomonadota bacterium]